MSDEGTAHEAGGVFALQGAWQRPSTRLLGMRRGETLASALALAAATGLIGATTSAALGIGLAAASLLLGALGLLWVTRRVRAWAYTERAGDLLVRRGVFVRRLSVVPYGRMQFVDVTAGPIERLFGLATLKLHTAAAASDARIVGLEAAEAERLRDELAAKGEAHLAGL